MQIHSLKRKTKNKKSVQVGRGGTRGKTSGRGTKGQNARSGRKKRPELRDIIKKIPKMRGRGKNGNTTIQVKPVTIRLETIVAAFSKGGKISPATLVAKKVLEMYKGQKQRVKIVSDGPRAQAGDISVKLIVSGCTVSAVAKEKIEKAGGEVK